MCELSFRRDLQENAPKEEMVLMILDIFVIEDMIEEETLCSNADACKLDATFT
jgi:hypothetical protein